MLPLILLLMAIGATLIHYLIRKKNFLELLFFYLLLFNVGFMGLLGAYAHLFMADETAESIGWKPGSPFQSEVGVANLAFGVLGILSFWMSRSFRCATALGVSIFLLGALCIHFVQYSKGDIAPNNIGLFIWIDDLVIPALLIGLIIYLRLKEWKP